jgi:rhodanese-related sulfurtransferase
MQDIILFIQHHPELAIALAIALVLLTFIEFLRQKQGANQLNPQQVTQLLNHKNAAILDIRPVENFAQGHIIGATSLPTNEIDSKLKKLEKFKNQPIVIVCKSGTESSRAAEKLSSHGFTVHVLTGGINAWQEANMPLIKG